MPCGDGTGPVWARMSRMGMGRGNMMCARPWRFAAPVDASVNRTMLKRHAEYLKSQLADIESRLTTEDEESIL
jgi:hypothetical protein